MAIADRSGLPIAAWVTSASPPEVTLVEKTLDVLLATALNDSDQLDARLWKERRIRLIAPHRDDRRRKTQDGRALPIPQTLEDRAPVRVAPELPPRPHEVRTSRRELPRLRFTRLCPHPCCGIYETGSSLTWCIAAYRTDCPVVELGLAGNDCPQPGSECVDVLDPATGARNQIYTTSDSLSAVTVVPVPEPSTAQLLSTGIVSLAVRRRHARGAPIG